MLLSKLVVWVAQTSSSPEVFPLVVGVLQLSGPLDDLRGARGILDMLALQLVHQRRRFCGVRELVEDGRVQLPSSLELEHR